MTRFLWTVNIKSFLKEKNPKSLVIKKKEKETHFIWYTNVHLHVTKAH